MIDIPICAQMNKVWTYYKKKIEKGKEKRND